MRYIFLFALLLSNIVCTTVYHKELINSTSALCLDGTQTVIYVSKGYTDKIMLHFESGGWCGEPTLEKTLQSCYNRSLTTFGSSKNTPDTLSFSYGMLSDNQPSYFTNWTKIFFSYCDGAGHQGYRQQPIKYKNGLLYFRGTNITLQRFDYLQAHYKLYSGTNEVVLSGASAGGLATYFWGNYLKTKLIKAKYWIFADSGIFLESNNFVNGNPDYKQSFRQLLSLSNTEIDPPIPQCNEKYPKTLEKCMLAENIIQFIEVDSFSVQSLYDVWSIQNILGISCTTSKLTMQNCTKEQKDYIQQYHRNTTVVLDKIKNLKAKKGFWANGCIYHGYSFFGAYNSQKFRIPSGSNYSIDYTFRQWKEGGGDLFVQDLESWPANQACSNYAMSELIREQ